MAKRAGIPCYRLMDTRAQMRADGVPYAEAAEIAQRMSRAWLVAKGYATPGFVEQPFTLSESEIDALNLVPDDLRGLDRYEARKRVVEQITAEGLAVTVLKKSIDKETGAEHLERVPYVESKPIMQPFGDRSKVVIEPMLTDQWFVDTAKIVEPALDAVRTGRTKIIPPSGEKTYYHWLENIEPWCISRQLCGGGTRSGLVWEGQDGKRFPRKEKAFCAPDEAFLKNMARTSSSILGIHRLENEPAVRRMDATSGFVGETPRKEIVKLPATPTSSTPGSPPASGPSARSAGRSPRRSCKILPHLGPRDGSGHPVLLGRPDDDDAACRGERHSVPHCLPARPRPRRQGQEDVEVLGNVIDPLEIIDEYGADALRFANAAMASLGGVLKLDTQRIAATATSAPSSGTPAALPR